MISNERLQEIADDCGSLDGYADFAEMAKELLELRKAFSGEPDAWMTVHVQSPTWDDPGGGPEYVELHELKPEYGNFDNSPAYELYRKQ
jgi:hypothetical protein